MVEKTYRHFEKTEGLFRALREIRDRLAFGYPDLAEMMRREIRAYFDRIPEKTDDLGKSVGPSLLVGLSGGVDSAVVASLAVKAAGVENVLAITLPAREDDESIYFSGVVREQLNMKDGSVQYVIPVGDIVRKEIETVNRLRWEGIEIRTSTRRQTDMDRMRIGNFASRARIAVLYDIARKVNGRILGTGNRTEFVQGYAAKYGTPISFDFGILDELYKTDVYELAHVLALPREIIERVPTTGYFPGQTHEEELGATWEEQDALAFLLFEKRLGVDEIRQSYHVRKAFIETMLRRYRRSKEKRMLRQPHIKLGAIDDGRP